ncbi:MAG TPA: phage holin family protein [Candidatus Andersenbacteria bacterium]|nr:phage holin family protein [Candidatus Andersenbacteria bacterium]
MNILLRWIINALAILAAAYIVPGIAVQGFGTALLVALVLGLLNIFIKPILILLTLPITIVTLGLFTFVINALLVLLTSKLVPGFFVAGFWQGLLFSIVFSIITSALIILEHKTVSNE